MVTRYKWLLGENSVEKMEAQRKVIVNRRYHEVININVPTNVCEIFFIIHFSLKSLSGYT